MRRREKCCTPTTCPSYTPLGYFGVIGLMGLIVSIQVLYFRREGLLGRGER